MKKSEKKLDEAEISKLRAQDTSMSGDAYDMYREAILDYYSKPRNKGSIQKPDFHFVDNNPLCGDIIQISGRVDGEILAEVKFEGDGCAISQASVSMLLEHVEGKSLKEIKELRNEDVFEMLGVPLSAMRIKCALLGLKTLERGIEEYQKSN